MLWSKPPNWCIPYVEVPQMTTARTSATQAIQGASDVRVVRSGLAQLFDIWNKLTTKPVIHDATMVITCAVEGWARVAMSKSTMHFRARTFSKLIPAVFWRCTKKTFAWRLFSMTCPAV